MNISTSLDSFEKKYSLCVMSELSKALSADTNHKVTGVRKTPFLSDNDKQRPFFD